MRFHKILLWGISGKPFDWLVTSKVSVLNICISNSSLRILSFSDSSSVYTLFKGTLSLDQDEGSPWTGCSVLRDEYATERFSLLLYC